MSMEPMREERRVSQEQYDQIIRDYQKLMKDLDGVTPLVKDMHRVLVGEPEFRRKGLVEIVDFHHLLLTKGLGAMAACGVLYAVLRAFGVLR